MGTLNQTVPTVGPLTAAQLTDEINTELVELYKRSFAKVGGAAGTNAYTGSIPLNRPLEDANGFIFVVPNANTGPCTFNGLPLVTNQGAALQAGQLSTGMVIAFIYNQPSNDYRVLTPLFAGTAPIVRVYSSPGTFIWTKPSGLVAILVEQQAPGGGGGGSSVASGGGSGSYGRRLIAASLLPPTVSIVNGSPGVGGTVGSTAGTNGGNSSFGAFLTTNGGARGLGAAGNNAGGAGGAAGTGGDVNEAGRAARSSQFSPEGAPSPSGGAGGLFESSVIQYPATLGGGGSGGVTGAANGGAGGPGRTIVTEYYS